jgi:lysophospholipid acyltransferase (LPLAT)-like uncharacterized protein
MSTATPATPAASSPSPAPVQTLAGWKQPAAALIGLLMRVWTSSLRITVAAGSDAALADPRPTLFVIWHNRLFIGAELSRRHRPGRPLHCLISASKDGAWLAACFEHAGVRTIRGSSSRGGREAAAGLVRVLRSGHDAGITPDGPRGPRYVFKPGALIVARRAGARVMALGVAYESAWRLRSWDRFFLPRPFSRVHLVLREIPPADLAADDAPARIEATLRALNPDE